MNTNVSLNVSKIDEKEPGDTNIRGLVHVI